MVILVFREFLAILAILVFREFLAIVVIVDRLVIRDILDLDCQVILDILVQEFLVIAVQAFLDILDILDQAFPVTADQA